MKRGWAFAGLVTVVAVTPAACGRRAAENGDYAWNVAGMAGESSAGAPAVKGSPSSGGSGADDGAVAGGSGEGPVTAASGGAHAEGGTGQSRPPSTAGTGGDGGQAGGDGGQTGGDGGNAQAGSDDGAGAGGTAGSGGACDLGLDTDEDGVADACDDDDDDDGYLDGEDPAPTDPTVPGGIAAPGTIAIDACVRDVLAHLAGLGRSMPIHRKQFPPDMVGYYVRPEGQGTILAANDGVPVGARLTGMEARIESAGTGRFDARVVDFTEGEPASYGIGFGAIVRGSGNEFTHFGSATTFVLLFSARRDSMGDWRDGFYLNIFLPTSGIPHAECPVGEGEFRFSSAPLTAKVAPEELHYMCVDENEGYVPTERWTRANGELCQCTMDYQVSCRAR